MVLSWILCCHMTLLPLRVHQKAFHILTRAERRIQGPGSRRLLPGGDEDFGNLGRGGFYWSFKESLWVGSRVQ